MIKFNGVSTDELGIVVEHYPQRSLPERSYEVIEVPGRDGDIIIDNGNFKNYRKSYSIFIDADNQDDQSYQETTRKLAEWLLSSPGYHRLEDSYDPDFYQMAYYSGGANFSNFFNVYGRGTLEFTCAPRRYFKRWENSFFAVNVNGMNPLDESTWYKVVGPTLMASNPLISIRMRQTTNDSPFINLVFDDGSMMVRVNTSESNRELAIDVEKRQIKYIVGSNDDTFTISSGSYDNLKLKNNSKIYVQLSGVSLVSNTLLIYPRWWTI